MIVRLASDADLPHVAGMRCRLHPDADPDELADELPALIADPRAYALLVADDGDGRLAGFAEAGRRNYAEGCPGEAAYLEAVWVEPDRRRTGVAKALLAAAEDWARGLGFAHFGSDALLHNETSHSWHRAAGFAEVERLVAFAKRIG